MIIDNIKNCDKYCCLDENYKLAFDFIKSENLDILEPGSYKIKNNEVYINIENYIPKLLRNTKLEAHRKYTDIQFIIKGEEKMGFCNIENTKAISNYDENKDIIFLEGKCNYINLQKNDFIIFDPNCAHKPLIKPYENYNNQTKKAIVKILHTR